MKLVKVGDCFFNARYFHCLNIHEQKHDKPLPNSYRLLTGPLDVHGWALTYCDVLLETCCKATAIWVLNELIAFLSADSHGVFDIDKSVSSYNKHGSKYV
jgi:hypothetical protein